MSKIKHYSMKVAILAILTSVIGSHAYGQSTGTINQSDILYWVGNGTNSAILIICYCNKANALAWGYRWNGNKTVAEMLSDIDEDDARLSISGIATNFITNFEYNDSKFPNYDFGNDIGSIMYNINGVFPGGVSSTNLTDGDVVKFGGISCTWNNLPVTPVDNPNPPTFNITASTSSYGTITPSGTTSVNQGDSVVFVITANSGYSLAELKAGSVDVTSQVLNNTFILRNIVSDSVVTAKFKVNPNNTITDSDIQYWVGTGNNKVIFAVNWCESDTALAWGYRFATDSVTVQQVMNDIAATDSRFAYAGTPYVSSITYTAAGIALSQTSGYWAYNVNEGGANAISQQKVTNGDIIEWGGTNCSITDDFWNNVWTKAITPVLSPTVGLDIVRDGNISVGIYPNPASDYAVIDLKGMNGRVYISIIDINGKEVLSQEVDADNTKTQQIDLSTYNKGIYFVRVKNTNGYIASKLVII